LGASKYRNVTHEAILAWEDDALTEDQRAWLDYLVRHGLLTNSLKQWALQHPGLAQEVELFRRAEAAVPIPHRAPGVMDADSYDAAFLPRGDHLKPGAPVPRGYLGVLEADAFANLGSRSGRLELARALTAPDNPLTARVMVNRIWLHLFGQGLVPTPDSFGKMGEPPSHPELLDFLADQLVQEGWSTKKMVRLLVLTRAWQLSASPHPGPWKRTRPTFCSVTRASAGWRPKASATPSSSSVGSLIPRCSAPAAPPTLRGAASISPSAAPP